MSNIKIKSLIQPTSKQNWNHQTISRIETLVLCVEEIILVLQILSSLDPSQKNLYRVNMSLSEFNIPKYFTPRYILSSSARNRK